ncbi:hypothetical protein TUSST3_53790 [Streptomyces sp. TUS-ST3]|nr:hypothetical protein TUSST3_53790 [Streptomyces sp. TUS-ST3]
MLRMPSEEALPPGPRREFVLELFFHYRDAGRPPLPKIALTTEQMPEAHKVSRETIRRLLTGQTTSQWAVVDAVLRALCHLQNRDPDQRRWSEEDDWRDDDPRTYRQVLRHLWNEDIDKAGTNDPTRVPPQTRAGWGASEKQPDGWGQSAPADNPWASNTPAPAPQPGGYSDEPPF